LRHADLLENRGGFPSPTLFLCHWKRWGGRARSTWGVAGAFSATASTCDNFDWLPSACRLHPAPRRTQLLPAPVHLELVCAVPRELAADRAVPSTHTNWIPCAVITVQLYRRPGRFTLRLARCGQTSGSSTTCSRRSCGTWRSPVPANEMNHVQRGLGWRLLRGHCQQQKIWSK